MKIENNHPTAIANFPKNQMQFGIQDMSLVMELLTKLYSNPINTLVQEYISNGRDAQREVNSQRPIEITLPGRINPLLSIRDFGPGLSPERIENVFLFYGASTKRHDDSQTGGFGIGAKSAWAYTDSFTIVSYVDGIRRDYVAHKSGGQGNLDLIFEGETSEPNGTEIKISVNPNDVPEFRAAVQRAVYFWGENERPVLKNCDSPCFFDGEKVNDNFYLLKNSPDFLRSMLGTYNNYNGYHNVAIVVDGIPYRVLNKIATTVSPIKHKVRHNSVIKVNTGDIKIAPTREDIVDDDKNNRFLSKLVTQISNDIDKYVSAQLSNYKSLNDKLKKYIELSNAFVVEAKCGNYAFYNGSIHIDKVAYNEPIFTKYSNYRRNRPALLGNVPISEFEHVYFDDVSESKTKRKYRMDQIINSRGNLYLLNLPIDGDARSKKIYDMIMSDFAVQGMSTIDVSGYIAPVRKTKAAVVKKEICFHYFDRGMSPTQIDIASINDLTAYDIRETGHKYYDERENTEFKQLVSYMGSIGIKFGYVAKSNLDKIENELKFVLMEDFLKTHIPKDDVILYNLYHRELVQYYNEFLCFAKGTVPSLEIEDEELANVVELLKQAGEIVSRLVPLEYFEQAVEDFKKRSKLRKVLDNPGQVKESISSKFPLLKIVDKYAIINQNGYKDELINYMNFRSKNG